MLTVMPAKAQHLDAVVMLEKQTFPEDAISRRSFKRFIESASADFRVALIDDQLVGYFVVLYRNNTNLARLYALVIAPDYRRTGYGRQLLEQAEEAADARHCLFLRTEIATSNQIAEQLLAKEGFRTIELREAYFPPSHSQSRAALKRGLFVRVEVNADGPLFIDSVRQTQKKEVMQRIQEADRTFLIDQGVAINVRDYTTELLKTDLARGALVMALISTYSFDGIRAPHWVLICAADDDFVYINDPDYDTLPWESSTQRQYLPIPISTFNKAFGYGGRKQKAAVVLTAK